MGMTSIRCRKCGEWFYGWSGGKATAQWREHFITVHTHIREEPDSDRMDSETVADATPRVDT